MKNFNNSEETFQIDLSDFTFKFKHELDYFKDYLKFNNDNFSKRRIQLDNFLKEDILEEPENESFFKEIYYMDYIKLPSYFYHSSLVSIYSFLEKSLNSICDTIQRETDFVIGIGDLNGTNIINRSRKFLSKVAKVDFSIVDKEWLRITDFQKLRNLIVHQNSQLQQFNQNISSSNDIKIISRFSGIEVDESNKFFYIKDKIVLSEFIILIEKFMTDIITQIKNRQFRKFRIVDIYSENLPF